MSEPDRDGVPRLLADVGGTNVRFALMSNGELRDRRQLKCALFQSFAAAVEEYLGEIPDARRPRQAAVAIACPVEGDEIRMTNHVWSFSVEAIRRSLGLERLVMLNDFEALALAVPSLPADACEMIKRGAPRERGTVALMGPGTGLGTSALVYGNGSSFALACEGGHRTPAPTTEREWEVYRLLAGRYGHVSAERVLSGPGLSGLYSALAELAGSNGGREPDPAEIAEAARTRSDLIAVETLELFSAWLGAVGGDLVLTLGARGGLILGGGILPKLGAAFDREQFTRRFVAKGRFASYLGEVPVQLIVRRGVTLLGAARVLAR